MPDKKDFFLLYKAEAEDRLCLLDKGLVALEKSPGDLDIIKDINREAHTLKGSSRAFGYIEIQEIAHEIESVLEAVMGGTLKFSQNIAQCIFHALDKMREVLEKISPESEIAGIDVKGVCEDLKNCMKLDKTRDKVKHVNAPKPGAPHKKEIPVIKPEPSKADVEPLAAVAQVSEDYVRISMGKIDSLMNLVGEVAIDRMKINQKIAHTRNFYQAIKDAHKEALNLKNIIGATSHLSNSKEIAEKHCESLEKLKNQYKSIIDDISGGNDNLDRFMDELQTKVRDLGLIACSSLFQTFPRMVRDIAVELKKKINFKISGESTELDKKVLEAIKTPLLHILRNCVDHGIEMPEDRKALGKKEEGTIHLSACYDAAHIVISVEDDGKGIDVDKIKETALRKGLFTLEELNKMTPEGIINIIFLSGFSTSNAVTEISGRGLGLDIVKKEIEQIDGHVHLDSQKNAGSKFTIILPLTVAVLKVILLRASGLFFAVPMASVLKCLKVKVSDIQTVDGKMAFKPNDTIIPIVDLKDALGLPLFSAKDGSDIKADDQEVSVILGRSLGKEKGFIVDKIIRDSEIFIRPLGEHLGKVKNIGGATILDEGEVVVVLDMAELILDSPAIAVPRSDKFHAKKAQRRILVVDDSLPTRELTKSILQANDYLVDTANDGRDGFEKLTQSKYDLVVTDVMMPNMDGFELCKAIKESDIYKTIPVIIVSSLEKEEEKRKGFDAGASVYIVKSNFNQVNLLEAIERLLE